LSKLTGPVVAALASLVSGFCRRRRRRRRLLRIGGADGGGATAVVDMTVFFTSDGVAVKATMRAGFGCTHPRGLS